MSGSRDSAKCAAAVALMALLLGACGDKEVDITITPEPMPTLTYNAQTPDISEQIQAQSSPDDMVKAVDIIPGVYTDIRYATENNFTGKVIYESAEVYLRRSTAEKLARVQLSLNAEGYSLCIWDGWRSRSAQIALWEACPDERYVANPYTGLSGHCRGNTVDITLVTTDGKPVEMPSGFDEFSALGDRDYSDVNPEAAENARRLEAAMLSEGFTPYFAEWWHYTDSDSYDFCEELPQTAE